MKHQKTYSIDTTGVVLTHITGKVIEIDKHKIEQHGKIRVLVVTPRGGGKPVEIALHKIDDSKCPFESGTAGAPSTRPAARQGGKGKRAAAPAVGTKVVAMQEVGNEVLLQLTVPKSFALQLLAPGDKVVKLSTTLAVLDVERV